MQDVGVVLREQPAQAPHPVRHRRRGRHVETVHGHAERPHLGREIVGRSQRAHDVAELVAIEVLEIVHEAPLRAPTAETLDEMDDRSHAPFSLQYTRLASW